jgi:hypothetical protein
VYAKVFFWNQAIQKNMAYFLPFLKNGRNFLDFFPKKIDTHTQILHVSQKNFRNL